QLAQPGEKVTFTITVSNPNQTPIPGVVVVDPLPAPLQFVGATTSQGTFTVIGNTITFAIGTLNPASSANMKVEALVPLSVVPPVNVTNTATVNGRVSASASVRVTAGKLPATGEHPDAGNDPKVWLLVALVGMSIVMIARSKRIFRLIRRDHK